MCQIVAVLFSTGQHRKGTEAVIQHTVAVSLTADREKIKKMIRGLMFDKDGLLVNCGLGNCNISALPGLFSALVCIGNLCLGYNQLKFLPANFGELKVGGTLHLQHNQLKSLPSNSWELKVGGDLWLSDNQLKSLPSNFGDLEVGAWVGICLCIPISCGHCQRALKTSVLVGRYIWPTISWVLT